MTVTTTTTTAANAAPGSAPLRPVRVAQLDDARADAAWGAYVRRHPTGTLFHHPVWAGAVQSAFGHRPCHLGAWRDEELVGVLPVVEMRSWLAGRLHVSMPYATYGGILADDDEVRGELFAAAQAQLAERGARLLELRSDTADLPDLPVDDRYAAFTKALPPDLKTLATYLPRKARAAARQAAQRENLVATHDSADLSRVHRLYVRSMRRLGSLAYPYRFFCELQQRLGRDCWVTVVSRDDVPVAGLLSFVFGDTVLPYFLGVDERVRCTGATNLIYYAVMERAVKSQLARFDFGRTRFGNAGPFNFKYNQGFEPRTLGYQRYIAPGAAEPDLSPANPRYQFARTVWRKLPLPVTQQLGQWLARSIPG